MIGYLRKAPLLDTSLSHRLLTYKSLLHKKLNIIGSKQTFCVYFPRLRREYILRYAFVLINEYKSTVSLSYYNKKLAPPPQQQYV